MLFVNLPTGLCYEQHWPMRSEQNCLTPEIGRC